MKANTKYDLRNLIQRIYDNLPCDSESEKAAVMARIYDVEEEINLTENGAYRKVDIVSLIESALEDKEKRMLAKIPDDLESIVAPNPTSPSKGKVVYGIITDYAKNILKLPRYALFGALPSKIQENLGEKYSEKSLNYTTTNIIAESVANAGLIVYLAHTIDFNKPSNLSVGGFIAFCFYSGCNLVYRSFIRIDNKDTNGNLFIRALYDSVDYTLSALKKKYITKRQELTVKLEQKKKLSQIETTETKQLPSPKSSRHKFIIR